MATKPNNAKNVPQKAQPKQTTKSSVAKPTEEKQQVTKEDVKKLPATTKAAPPPVEYDEAMLAAMSEDAGAGVSTKAEDNIVPLIYTLQAQSPQVLRQKPQFIEGSKAGDFWFRGTRDVVDGESEGMEVVLCHMSKPWVEWKPDRGGLAGRYAEKPDDAKWVPDPKDPKAGVWELPSGNYVVETREHVVIVVATGEPYVLPLSGSNHGSARDWMSKCNRKRNPGTGSKSPLWGWVWRLKTVPKSNEKGDWYGVQVEEALDDDGNQKMTWMLDGGQTYQAARQLHEDFQSGAKQSDQGDDGDYVGDADGDDTDDGVGGAVDDVM